MSQSLVCTICARGGSKGVPGKNVRPLLGKPLIAHSVEQALDSGLFKTVAVSSDDEKILSAAQSFGAHELIERPAELATDQAGKLPAIRHCALEAAKKTGYSYDLVVDLDATSPLRLVEDIGNVVALLADPKATNVVTATPSRRSPYFNQVEYKESGRLDLCKSSPGQVLSRQRAPKTFDLVASIYAWRWPVIMSEDRLLLEGTRMFELPPERSMDIDEEIDFRLVEFLMTQERPATPL